MPAARIGAMDRIAQFLGIFRITLVLSWKTNVIPRRRRLPDPVLKKRIMSILIDTSFGIQCHAQTGTAPAGSSSARHTTEDERP